MGVRAGFTKCDVAVEEDVEKLIADAVEFGGGKLDVIVNAAGVICLQDLMYIKPEEVERLFSINVGGTVNMLKHGLKVLEGQKSGNFITVSSIAGRDGMNMLQAYSASKAAVTSLTQSAAKMAAPYGVRVSSILPGIIRTAMREEILDGMANEWNPDVKNTTTPEQREELWNASVKSMIPMGHAQQAEDIAWATVFMASDFAREITGECLSIDGGAPVAGTSKTTYPLGWLSVHLDERPFSPTGKTRREGPLDCYFVHWPGGAAGRLPLPAIVVWWGV